MENLRIMSFDLDSFSLVKSKIERANKVIDFMRNYDIDLAMLQTDDNVLYAMLSMIYDYEQIAEYSYNLLLLKKNLECVKSFESSYFCSSIFQFYINLISIYNMKNFEKSNMRKFNKVLEKVLFVEEMVLGGTFKNIDIDRFCSKYNLDNVCSEKSVNRILVSKGVDTNVVTNNGIDGALVKPIV